MEIIILVIIIFTIIMLFIKNFDSIKNFYEKKENLLDKYGIKIAIGMIIATILIAIIVYYIIALVENCLNMFPKFKNDAFYKQEDEKVYSQLNYYKEVIKVDYSFDNSKNPYIPEGFSYIEGKWDTGFVIEDENNNQYVWIPCSNKQNDEGIVVLNKYEYNSDSSVQYYYCYDDEYKEFLNSALVNGGFYIARYEASMDENDNVLSKAGNTVLTGLEKDEFETKLYSNENFKISLINSYAYDTTLEWILNNNEIEKFEFDKGNLLTGRNEYNNIYDFTDNALELTMENFYDQLVVRGFSSVSYVKDENRYAESSAIKEENKDIYTYRTMLYKIEK